MMKLWILYFGAVRFRRLEKMLERMEKLVIKYSIRALKPRTNWETLAQRYLLYLYLYLSYQCFSMSYCLIPAGKECFIKYF
jgi:hypothetical protein